MAIDQLLPSTFSETKPMFPAGQEPTPEPQAVNKPLSPEVMMKMPVDMLIDYEVTDMVNDRYELSKNWRRTRRLIWDKCWQNMKAVYDKAGKANWQSTTFQPATSKVVEVIVANLHGAMFGPDVPIEWQPRRQDMDPQIRAINEVIQADLDKCSAKAHWTDFLRTLCVCGTAIGEVGYSKEEETVMIKQRQNSSSVDPMLQSMGINTQEQFIPKKILVKDFATIKNVDLYDIYPQPRIAEFSKDTWVIHKGKITNKELVMGARDPDPYYRFDNVTDDLLSGSGLQRVDQDPEKQVRRYALLDYFTANHFLDPDREHELKTFYGQIPLWYLQPDIRKDKNRQYDSVPGWIQIVDGQYVIRKRISPWRDGEPPYFKGNYIRFEGEFYGVGVAELMLGLQVEKNEIRNSRMDNINLAMNKIVAVIKDMVPPGEWQRLKSQPGAVWIFKGIDDIKKAMTTVELGDVTKDTWMASQEVDREIQEVTAAVKATIGVGGGSDQTGGITFRGQMLNSQAATERWMLYARVLEVMGLMPAIKKFYQRIYQFKGFPDIAMILGPERAQIFQFIAPEELEKMAKLVPLGVMTMETKGVQLAQLAQFTQQWAMQPWFKGVEVARAELTRMGFPEPDKFLFSDQELQQYNQQRQQMMNSMPGMGGPGGPPQGLVGPNGQPLPPGGPPSGGPPSGGPPSGPQSGNRANVPGGQPVAGNVPGPAYGMARPALPARGPGASPNDLTGRPMS